MTNFEHYLPYINRNKYPKLMKIVNKGIEAEENYDKERFNTAMMLCRQVIESIMKVIAEDKGIMFKHSTQNTTLMEMMNELVNKMGWGDYYKAKLHGTRMLGNDAIHDIDNDSPEEAFNAIKDVYTLFDLLFKLYYAPKHFQEKPFSLTNEESVTVLEKKEIVSESNELNLVYHPTQINTPVEAVNHTEESKLNDNEQRWKWWLSLTPQQKEFLLVDVLQIKTFNMQYAEHREIIEAYNSLNDLFELTEITFVDVQNPPIDLSLLNNFKNLEKLTMSHCKFDMMQLIQLKQLKSLDISRNNISDISPLVLLKDLQDLNLSHNEIIDMSPLSKLQLKSLDISHNNISDIIPLIVFKDLQCLNLSHNQIRDVSPLYKLQQLNDLDISNNQIYDISPLAELNNLETLNVYGNEILDITPLAKLKQLTDLEVGNNNISDINCLTQLKQLKELNASENKIYNINSLAELSNLEILNVYGNEILDITPLAKLKQLKDLEVGNNNISDINCLTQLKQLKELGAGENKISDITPLAELSNLEVLYINDNQISKITPLAQLKQLKELNASKNKIYNITSFTELSNLKVLYINDNQISDITPLAKLKQLKDLKVGNNNTSDISLKQLKELNAVIAPVKQQTKINTVQSLSSQQVEFKKRLAWWKSLSPKWKSLFTQRVLGWEEFDNRLISNQEFMESYLDKIFSLKELNLSNCNLENINSLAVLQNLEVLDISYNPIREIRIIKDLKKLKQLNIHQSSHHFHSYRDEFTRTLPKNLQIIW